MTVRLADAYGFCWGVERAVQMAYEARRAYPDRKLHVTNEIIHNPSVNQVCCSAGRTRSCRCPPVRAQAHIGRPHSRARFNP